MSNEKLLGEKPHLNPQEVFHAGAELLEHFNINIDPAAEPDRFQEALKQIDPRYKGDRHLIRYDLESDENEWPDRTKQVIIQAAENMRMTSFNSEGETVKIETPLEGHYDLVVTLGGARQANLDRLRYAVDALNNGHASFDRLVVAGAQRPLRDDEKANVVNYAPKAETEMDLLVAAAKVIEGENPGLNVAVFGIDYEKPDGKKAGTPDVLDSLFTNLQAESEIQPGSRVGIVTTQIYQVSTELDSMRIGRKYGLETWAAGNPSDPRIIKARTPATYLSEVLRTLKAATLAAQSEV